MDREIVLGALAFALGGPALLSVGWRRRAAPATESGVDLERQAWRGLWLPILPAALLLAALIGWALSEPESSEPVPRHLACAALLFALLFARAAFRALRAALRPPGEGPAITVGLLRPRIVVSRGLADRIDEPALRAAEAHEVAHARHRDPLRIWLAQIATDLQWPWPAAAERFQRWLRTLELARDEEARRAGAAGEDLADAIIAAAQMHAGSRDAQVAGTLVGQEPALKDRIRRLLSPVAPNPDRRRPRVLVLVIGCGLCLAVSVGATLGEAAVRALLGASP